MSLLPYSLFAILSVAACTPMAPNDSPPGGGDGGGSAPADKPRMTGGPLPPEEHIRVGPGLEDASCNADAVQSFVGRKADAATVKAAVAASGAKTARVIGPDMMVTMDYRGDRLNLSVDDAGKILAVSCG